MVSLQGHKKLDVFDPSKIAEVVTQAVAGGYQVFPKTKHIPKANKPIHSITTKATGKSKYKSVWQTISRAT